MTRIFGGVKINTLLKISTRNKHGHGPEHWSMLKKKIRARDKALEHFDDFYATVYSGIWSHVRSALLREDSKYVAVVNNFGNVEETVEKLQLLGALNVRDLYNVHKQAKVDRDKKSGTIDGNDKISTDNQDKNNVLNKPIDEMLERQTQKEIQSLFPESYEAPKKFTGGERDEEDLSKGNKPLEPIKMRPLEQDIANAKIDEQRIVKPSIGLTSSTLNEYIPATKIKGLDDYVLESDHYSYYSKSADFNITVESETELNFPEHLKVFTFDAGNNSRFPTPRRGTTEVLNYYCMDGASILPVLALDLQAGDTMLDMCAAPGGKSLVALQTLMPKVLVANDQKLGRVNHMNDVMQEYLGNLNSWDGRLFLTHRDGREIEDVNMYNKILVDVPCTTDRHSLHEDDNNIFKVSRIKERLQLPDYQAKILLQALKLIAPGGTVVYATCSLSPIQNDGVVQMALKKFWEESDSVMVVKDMTKAFGPLSCLYKFGNDFGTKYGQIVLPLKKNNWGPMYFSKIVRVK